VYHEPNYVLRPFTGPAVTTIHDLGWLHFPHTLKTATRRIMERGMPQTLRRAAHFITVSRFVAEELTREFGIQPDRISVTPLGVDSRFRPFDVVESRLLMDRLDLVHGRYLLAVGTLEPRKNLSALVNAYGGLPTRLQERVPLVLAGGRGWGEALGAHAARLQRAGRIRLLGYVSESDLVLLYAGAACFIMPSLYEGFGIPILEAMASGVPVVTSNRSAMPEVAGDAALLVDPDDITSIRDAVRQLLEDSSLCQRLVRAGLARASTFSWQQTVDSTLAVYRQIS
jgi:alpha-1,3-rhamnosyl/mannosyltransferase